MLGCKGFFLGDEPYDPSEGRVEVRFVTRDKDGIMWSDTKYSPLHSVSFCCLISFYLSQQ